ncbi:MAG: hypothetical protein ACU84H_03950 [Gammaproteobacteria bacterium]
MILKNIALTAPLFIIVGFQFYMFLELNDQLNQISQPDIQSRLIPFENHCNGRLLKMPVLQEYLVPDSSSSGQFPKVLNPQQFAM